jgi:hypothetical protein
MKNTLSHILLFLAPLFCIAQYVVRDIEEVNNLNILSQERVYVSVSENVFLPGEYLFYQFYCFNSANSKLSNISSVGYIELIDQKGEIKTHQKLRLEHGLAQGDFFIPVDVQTGNYKLIGYTYWMTNLTVKQAFVKDIYIINPYKDSNKLKIVEDNDVNTINEKITNSSTKDLQIILDTKLVKTREKVSFSIRNFKDYLGKGTYTIKVVKKPEFSQLENKYAVDYKDYFTNSAKQLNLKIGDTVNLPEQRGELFYGQVKNHKGFNVSNQMVVLSLPGKESILKYAKTNSEGFYYAYIKKPYKLDRMVVQPLNPTDSIKVEWGLKKTIEQNGFTPKEIVLRKRDIDKIKLRSIHNQIENQFFEVKPDSILMGDRIDPFDGGVPEVVYLDDYTRFNTLEETLVEILNNAGYRNNNKGLDYIRILQDFEKVTEDYNNYPSIVLIDGVFIPNHESIRQYNAHKIKSISLIRDQFVLGNKDYQGIMAIETFDGDFFKNYVPQIGINKNIETPISKKQYFTQSYDLLKENYIHVPDYRRVLLWEPSFEVNKEISNFTFYTSDIKGDFMIILDGFISYGKPIFLSQSFSVE